MVSDSSRHWFGLGPRLYARRLPSARAAVAHGLDLSHGIVGPAARGFRWRTGSAGACRSEELAILRPGRSVAAAPWRVVVRARGDHVSLRGSERHSSRSWLGPRAHGIR